MTRKTFLWNFKAQSFTYKKAINKELFFKSLVREYVEDDKRLRLIDDGSTIFDIITTKKPVKKRKRFFFKKKKKKNNKKDKFLGLTKKQKSRRKKWLRLLKNIKRAKKKAWLNKKRKRIGAYITVEKQILKHKFWDKIRLNIPLISNPKNKTSVLKLRNCINRLALSKAFNKKENLPVRVLKPKKGGFIVRFSVIKGFLPKAQFKRAKNAVLKDLSSKNKAISKTIQTIRKEFSLFNDNFNTMKQKISSSENILSTQKNRSLIRLFNKRLDHYKKNLLLLKQRKNSFIRNVNKFTSLKKIKNNSIRLPLKIDFLTFRSPNVRAKFVKKRWWYKRKKLKITKKGLLKKPVFFFKKITCINKFYKKSNFKPYLWRTVKNYEFKQNKKKSKLFISTKRTKNS